MSKYLILKLGALGDIGYFLPCIDLIRQKDPNAQITWIVGSTYQSFLQQHPFIDRVIPINEKKLFHSRFLTRLPEILKLWAQLDLTYDQIWLGHRTLAALLLLRFRVFGKFFQVVRSPSFLGKIVRTEVIIPPLQIHESLAFKKLTEAALQATIPNQQWTSQFLLETAPRAPLSSTRRIAIHLGGGSNLKTEFQLKKWPHWSILIRKILAQTSLQVLLVGGPDDQDAASQIIQEFKNYSGRIRSKVGETPSFTELIQEIKGTQLFIGVDSGPLHLADGSGVPTIGLYGPTSPISWGLLNPHSKALSAGTACSPCYRDDGEFPLCPYQTKCMRELTPEQVFQTVCLALGVSARTEP